MTTPSHDASPSADLGAPWVRRLAAALLDDPSAADDVVQEAWLRLGGAPRAPGYVAAVVRSLALRRHRSEGRRARRERDVARPEAVPSTAEVAGRAEAARRLAQAVEALEEPYRTTIVLRYHDGLSGAEIARRTKTPEGTVRARLKRGLERLRARLDESAGGRATWAVALAPLAPVRTAAVRPQAGVAVASLALSLEVALLASLAVAGLALAWSLSRPGRPPEQPVPPLVAGTPHGDSGGPDSDDVERPPAGSRIAMSAGSAEPMAGKTDGEVARVAVRARLVDEGGSGLQGAWLRVRGAEPTSHGEADGSVRLELQRLELERLAAGPGGRLVVELGATGRRTRNQRLALPPADRDLELGEVVLGPGAAVLGRVVDPIGLGVEGALVVAGAPLDPRMDRERAVAGGPAELRDDSFSGAEPPLTARSGPGGAFRIDGLAPGHLTVWARTGRSRWTFSDPVGVRAGDEVGGVELRVLDDPEGVIAGTVLDPDGCPLPDVELTFSKSPGPSGSTSVRTDGEGAFHFVPWDGPQDIHADSPTPRWEDTEVRGVEPGSHDLEIHFVPTRWIELGARDPSGAPVRGGRAFVLPGSGPTVRPLPRSEAVLDEHGQARLRRPSSAFRVRIEAPGYRDLIAGPFEPDFLPDPLVATLEPVPALVGQVRLPDGRPAAGATVSLHRGAWWGVSPPGGSGPDPRHFTHQGWPGDGEPLVYRLAVEPMAEVRADAEGRYRLSLPGVDATSPDHEEEPEQLMAGFRLKSDREVTSRAPPEKDWYVYARLEREASVTSGPHRFDPQVAAGHDTELDLSLPRAGALTGRLTVAGRSSAAGWTLVASDGLAEVAQVAVAPDGTFGLEHLHAGGWQLRALAPGARYYPGQMFTSRVPVPDVEVVEGRTVGYEHTTRARESARLQGLLWIDGAPPGAARVQVRTSTPQSSISSHEATLDPDGRFEVALQPGLKTFVNITSAGGGGRLTVTDRPTIVPGDNAWSLDLPTASLEGVLDPTSVEEVLQRDVEYRHERGEVKVRVSIYVDDQGRFGPVRVPAGRGALQGPRPNYTEPAPVLAELELAPGEERVLDLR